MMNQADFRKRHIDSVLVPVLSGLIFVAAHFHSLTNPFVINDDVQQQIYWMQQWLDKDLYPDFWLLDYSRHYVPWGVQGIYRLASLFMDPISFSKVLTGFLFILTAMAFHRIGRVLHDRLTAWTVLFAFWLMPFFLFRISGGLARSFAFPLLALFLFFWLSGRGWSMGVVLLGMAFTIPYIFVLSLTAVLAGRFKDILFGRDGIRTPIPTKTGHYLLLGAGVVILLLWQHQYAASGFGPLVSEQEMIGNLEYGFRGRYPILPVPGFIGETVLLPWQWIGPYRETGNLWLGVVGALVVFGIACWGATRFEWKRLKGKWQPFFFMGFSSLVFYVLARLFLLKLFIPSRYLTYSITVFYCILLGLCLRGLIRSALGPFGMKLLTAAVVGLSVARLYGVGIYDYSQYEPLYRVLAGTPKSALIAGHPYLLDRVLTFCKRNVFASFELAQPWSRGLWQKLKPRLKEFFNAYYAGDISTVREFCRRYGVDFLVVDTRHFTGDFVKDRPFFAPFDQMIRKSAGNRRHFALLSENPFPVTRIDANIFLFDLRGVKKTGFSPVPKGDAQ